MKIAAIAFISIFVSVPAWAEFASYGDVSVVSPGPAGSNEAAVFQLTATPVGWAGLYWLPSAATTASEITNLSAMYQMTIGTFGGGAPRFSIGDSGNHEAWIYWGNAAGGGAFTDPNTGTWASTGNYADLSSSVVRVYSNNFGGVNSPNTGMTWSQFIAAAGDTGVSYVSLDLDGGWGQAPNGQQMDVNYFAVNNEVDATPEPGTFVLMGIPLVAMGIVRKRKAVRV